MNTGDCEVVMKKQKNETKRHLICQFCGGLDGHADGEANNCAVKAAAASALMKSLQNDLALAMYILDRTTFLQDLADRISVAHLKRPECRRTLSAKRSPSSFDRDQRGAF